MRLSEKLVFLAFLGAFVAVYVSAAGIIVRGVFCKLIRKTHTPTRLRRWVRRIILGVAVIGILCIGYGYLVEPYWLEVTEVSLVSVKLPPDAHPIRLVHISDLHCDRTERLEDELPEVIKQLNPDVIAFTGDAANSPGGMANFRRCMSRLVRLAPVLVVDGNWDRWTDVYSGTGVRKMEAEAVKVQLSGTEIWFVGVPYGQSGSIDTVMESVPLGRLTILLYHSPCEIVRAARLKVDLYLAGHTHGGQVALPFYGALVTLSRYGKRYEDGLHREKNTWLYVNRGIGMEGGFAPRVRFLARPEVTLIEITPHK